jgi:uncharacterized membrane protein
MGEQRRWFNPAQPQTLQIAVFLLYITAAFDLLDMILYASVRSLFGILLIVAGVAAGYNIANERRFGYALGIVMAFLPFGLRFLVFGNPLEGAGLIKLIFEVALVALLLHPMSRDYQRIWFK